MANQTGNDADSESWEISSHQAKPPPAHELEQEKITPPPKAKLLPQSQYFTNQARLARTG